MAKAKYGHAHQKLRAEWKQRVDAGSVHCHAEEHGHPCVNPEGTLIKPGTKWALGHFDVHLDPDGVRPPAPEHAKCNGRTSAIWREHAQAKESYGWFT